MIDRWMVATNGLWILGLSIVLAASSYHYWLVRDTGRRGRDVFRDRAFRRAGASGVVLTCVGLGLSQADQWWERALWFGVAMLLVIAIRD